MEKVKRDQIVTFREQADLPEEWLGVHFKCLEDASRVVLAKVHANCKINHIRIGTNVSIDIDDLVPVIKKPLTYKDMSL